MKTGSRRLPLLTVRDLSVAFRDVPDTRVLEGVSFDVLPGEVVGLIGRSGAGKSLTALTLLGLLPPAARVLAGTVRLGDVDVLAADEEALRQLRGGRVGLMFQDPLSALHPCLPVDLQVIEGLAWERRSSMRAQRPEALRLLRQVGTPDPDLWGPRLPHQWSGGMRQRAVLAMALARSPELLIVDEPTTALDVTLQAQVLQMIRRVRDRFGMAVLLITHDLGVVAELADRLLVMEAGRIVETGPVARLFDDPAHPATRDLLGGRLPRVAAAKPFPPDPSAGAQFRGEIRTESVRGPPRPRLLEVRNLSVRVEDTLAVESVDLVLDSGAGLGLVGESGCGKSTIARTIVGLEHGASGSVRVAGKEVLGRSAAGLRAIRRMVQVVWQDPLASLNPRRSVGWSVERPLRIHGAPARSRTDHGASALLERVGLPSSYATRRPAELSGGELQRVAIARALALEPRLLILDEPFSAIDASLRKGLIDLLAKLTRDLQVAYLLISHDLSVVRALVDHVAVIYLGRVVEQGPIESVFSSPAHPYTRALISATPVGHPKQRGHTDQILLEGEVPSAARRPAGCAFHTRCWKAQTRCVSKRPSTVALSAGHTAACILLHMDGAQEG